MKTDTESMTKPECSFDLVQLTINITFCVQLIVRCDLFSGNYKHDKHEHKNTLLLHETNGGPVAGKLPNFKKKTPPTTVSILAVGFAAKQHLQTVPEHDCTVLDPAIERSAERERGRYNSVRSKQKKT